MGRSRSQRACRLYHVTAKTSAANSSGRVVPGIARPVTMVAMIGVATSPAPGNAGLRHTDDQGGNRPRIRLPRVNTGAAYVSRILAVHVTVRLRLWCAAGARHRPSPLHSLRSLTTHGSPKDGDSNEQGEV